ncbi:MAG: S-layer homology domain-containing protein [Oscillospiraceae bacterium]|nr:S-layer homology domain-containing protein [Oscillospiraceae bacterium]
MKKRLLIVLTALLALCVLLSIAVFAENELPIVPGASEASAATEATEPTEPTEFQYEYPNDWSRPALVFAVENGVLAGDENHNLNPQANITRAEMAAVLVRLLGASEPCDLSAYQDVDPAAWYCTELSCAVNAGIFGGVSATSMQPNAPITREQAIVVLSRAFGITSLNRERYKDFTDGSDVSSWARDALSAMKLQGLANGYDDGSFGPQNSITRAEVAQLLFNLFDCIADSPADIPASGWVLYRGSEPLPGALRLDGTLIIGQAIDPKIVAFDWSVTDSVMLRTGKDTNADLSGLKATRLICAPLSGRINGKASEVYLWGAGCSFYGNAAMLVSMDGTQSAVGDYSTTELRAGHLTVTGNPGKVTCYANTHLTVNDGKAESIDVNGKYVTVDGTGSAALITINAGNFDITLPCDRLDDTWYQTYVKEHDNALSTVKTQMVPCTVEKDTDLYSYQGGGGWIRSLPKGTIVYNLFHPAGTWFYVACTDGTRGWVPRWDCYIPDDPPGATNGSLDYSDATKEGFVDLKGYSSKTNYLVWVSRYTQKVIVFTGEKENWKVYKTFPCSSGANNCPTPEGIYEIYLSGDHWNFDNYYVTNVTLFNGDIGFHSILYNYDGSIFDGTLGYPMSHGCIRMSFADSNFMETLPLGTTVVVY